MERAKGYLLIAAASVIWGTMGIFGKMAFAYGVHPVTLTALRIAISSIIMLFLIAFFNRKLLKIRRQHVPQLIVFGVFAVAFQRVAYFYTVNLTTATIAAIMFYTYPIFVTAYTATFLKERITSLTITAITLALFGVALVVKAYETAWLNANILGLAFGTLTSVLFALYFLMAKNLREHYTNWTLLLYGDGIGAIALAPTLLFVYPEITSYTPELWLLICVIALFPSLTAYLLFSYALKYVESTKGSILSLIEPLSAAAFSTTILGETFEPLQILGVALALVGILLLFYKPKTKR
ncbi:MAG: DMT family transporter [Candidatus Bathyarchaeia archaeon]